MVDRNIPIHSNKMELRKLYLANNVEELYRKAYDEAVHEEDIKNYEPRHLFHLLEKARSKEMTERDEEEAYLFYVRSLRMLRHTELHDLAAAMSFIEVNLIKTLEELHEKLTKRYDKRNSRPQARAKRELKVNIKASEVASGCAVNEQQEDLKISAGDLTEVAPKEEIQRILECPICVSIRPGQIFSCINGHIICGICRPKTTICGICRGNYSSSRNFIAEKIIYASKFACDLGCGLILTGDKMVQHRSVCPFRPIPCHYNGLSYCRGSAMRQQDYLVHLLTVHDDKNLNARDGKFIVTYNLLKNTVEKVWRGGFVTFDGEVFFTRSFCDNTCVHHSLSVLGSDMDAAKYMVKIKLVFDNPATPNRYFEVTMSVVLNSTTNDEIEKSCHVVLNKSNLHQHDANIATTWYTWKLSYEIFKNQ